MVDCRSGTIKIIKMVKYMAMGLPIISKPIGTRGLEIKNWRHICFKLNTFDLVITIHIIEDLRNPEKLIGEARRVLRPRGYLFIVPSIPESDKRSKYEI